MSILTIRIYLDADGSSNVEAKSFDGSTSKTIFTPPDMDFASRLIKLQRAFAHSSASVRGIEAVQAFDIGSTTFQDIGTRLFRMLFNGDVYASYQKLRDDANINRRSNEIRIRNEVPAFSFIPWELMFDSDIGQFLSCYEFTHLARGVGLVDIPSQRTTPIAILGMAARPKTLDSRVIGFIDADHEQRRITDAFSDLETDGRVDLFWTQSGSVSSLRFRLDRPPRKTDASNRSWDVFHFIGHGGIDRTGRGYLIVQEDGGSEGKLLYADRLSALLAKPNGPQLVVLSSCSGAQAKPGELFSDTASSLVRAGIPAVVAMQAEITDGAAILFSTSFYTSLANGKTVQSSLTDARNIMNDTLSTSTEWPIPVLYLRGDGQMFSQN